jgi:hypothetical protein
LCQDEEKLAKKNPFRRFSDEFVPKGEPALRMWRKRCASSHRIKGFKAGPGWDATTGMGSPKADQVVNFLTLFTSDSDAYQAMNNSDPSATQHGGHHKIGPH